LKTSGSIASKNFNFLLREGAINYSLEGSGNAFFTFLQSLNYTRNSIDQIKKAVRETHVRFPSVEWLNTQIINIGLIETGKQIVPNSAKGTTYLHFLAITGLVKISFYDYFCTNPTSILKLDRWIEPYKDPLGIEKFVTTLLEVSDTCENRQINPKRQTVLGNKIGIYLVIRYNLDNLSNISLEQWCEFMLECRDHAKNKIANGYAMPIASLRLMHTALLHMGAIDVPYTRDIGGVKNIREEYEFLDHPDFGLYAATFLAFVETSKEKGTIGHYKTSLKYFFNYLISNKPEDFKLCDLTRADVTNYITYLFLEMNNNNLSDKFLESRVGCLKTYLTFISENKADFERQGIGVFKNRIIVDSDFKIPTIQRLPKSLEKEIQNALVTTLLSVESVRYRLVFLLMLTTGLSKLDAIYLKNNCLTYDEATKKYSLTFWRIKVKKEGKVEPHAQVIPIIEKLLSMNTQQVPLKHPDGSYAIFLSNDAGNPLGHHFIDNWLAKHKKVAGEAFPALARIIEEITSGQLRHTFASTLREGGADIMQIKALMLHESINTTHKYTKESDPLKIKLVTALENGEYVCVAYPKLDQQYLNSEQGQEFIANMIKFENKFNYGRCTVNGYSNCKKAYRCLTCGYLCSTRDDLPEILSSIKIQHLQFQDLSRKLSLEVEEKKISAMVFEKDRIKQRLQVLSGKVRKMQSIAKNDSGNAINVIPIYDDCDDALTFV